jgi:hypothetical protein
MREIRRTIKLYAGDAGHALGVLKPEWMRWERTSKDLQNLNRHALDMAEQLGHSMIIDSTKASMPTLLKQATEVKVVAWEMYDEVRIEVTEATRERMAQISSRLLLGY